MRTIDKPDIFRENINKKLLLLIDDAKIVSNLEKGIYNYSIQEANGKNILKKWNNPYFVLLYLNKFRSIYINLGNSDLLNLVKSKKIRAHKIGMMTHQEMNPGKWKKLIEIKKLHDDNMCAPKIMSNTDDFKCGKCKSKNCSYYQLQTRSADESMTTFVSCIDCGNRWKC
uniref:TFIIS-type domain-containing protein n=1 Tax=viral metagenome TaxID=1070528 RepID=A0A6C0BXT5_9ZZZZ